MSLPERAPPPLLAPADVRELLTRHRPSTGFDLDGVLHVASRVDRLAYAFAVAYDAALHQLVPAALGVTALAATEGRSAHPRDLRTTLDASGRLAGVKSFVTLGTVADTLLVVARTEVPQPDGRPELKLVSVSATAEGVTLEELPRTPFAPELPHARVTFHGAEGHVLPGDGYTRYMKPFRTVEDVWVHAALVAWLLGAASRDSWPASFVADGEALLARARRLVASEPSSAETHVALAACIDDARELVRRASFSDAAQAERAMFERDKPLLWVAEHARTERLSRARAAIA